MYVLKKKKKLTKNSLPPSSLLSSSASILFPPHSSFSPPSALLSPPDSSLPPTSHILPLPSSVRDPHSSILPPLSSLLLTPPSSIFAPPASILTFLLPRIVSFFLNSQTGKILIQNFTRTHLNTHTLHHTLPSASLPFSLTSFFFFLKFLRRSCWDVKQKKKAAERTPSKTLFQPRL